MIYGRGEKQMEEYEFEQWCIRETPPLTDAQLQYLLAHPPKLCDDKEDCKWTYCGDGEGCPCMRSLFLSGEQLNQYQRMVRLHVMVLIFKIIDSSISLEKGFPVKSRKELTGTYK
jgi:hypothetical protein